ncbi:hypothetical protein PR558_001251, partial [Campylobacter lari]|nr:hypothetical protein [Campylobacter lari]
LSLYNLSTLMQDIQKRNLKLEYNSKSFDKDSIFLSKYDYECEVEVI